MTRCGAVYIVLGERPELDRLVRCTLDGCPDHRTQLDWVRADPGRLATYNAQLRRYDLGQRVGGLAKQLPMLPVPARETGRAGRYQLDGDAGR